MHRLISNHKATGKQKVALVQNSFRYARRFRLGLMRYLRDNGLEVYALAPAGEEEDAQALIKEGIIVVPFHGKIYSMGVLTELAALWSLIRLYRQQHFFLAIHYTIKPNIYGALAACLSNTPCIAITTGLGILKQRPYGLRAWIMRRLYQLAVSFSREIWFLNKSDRAFFVAKGIAPPSKTFVLGGEGVDTAYYHPACIQERQDDGSFRILYTGRMLRSKGLEELFQASRYFREKNLPIHIQVLGLVVPEHPDAIPPEILREWEAQGNFRYYPGVEDVRPYMALADAVVLPSYGEGMSRTLLEACSTGLPVIASDVEGCREIVQPGINGFLCKPKDSDSLVAAIQHLYALSPAERQKMGKEGRRLTIQYFDEKEVIHRYASRLGPLLGLELHKLESAAAQLPVKP